MKITLKLFSDLAFCLGENGLPEPFSISLGIRPVWPRKLRLPVSGCRYCLFCASLSMPSYSQHQVRVSCSTVDSLLAMMQVYNTYGTLSNAALLCRYGFTELDNPFDIVNIDMSLVVDSFGEEYTSRHVRRRVTKWKKVCFSQRDAEDCEYFEISATGKPEEGLLMLMYIMHMTDEHFDTLTDMSDSCDSDNKIESIACFLGWSGRAEEPSAAKRRKSKSKSQDKRLEEEKLKLDLETWLLTAPVCRSMLRVLRLRNGLYPTESIEADEAMLSTTYRTEHAERFHALSLRISERSILRKFETCLTKRPNLLIKVK